MRTLNTTSVREETRGPTQNTSLDLRHQEDLRETTNSTYSAPSQIFTGTPSEQGKQKASPRPYLYSPTRLPNTHTRTPQVRHRQHTPNLLLSPFQDGNRAAASAGFPLADSVSHSHAHGLSHNANDTPPPRAGRPSDIIAAVLSLACQLTHPRHTPRVARPVHGRSYPPQPAPSIPAPP